MNLETDKALQLIDIISDVDYFEDVVNFNLNLGFLFNSKQAMFYETRISNTLPLSGVGLDDKETHGLLIREDTPLRIGRCLDIAAEGCGNYKDFSIDMLNTIELCGDANNSRDIILPKTLNSTKNLKLFLNPQYKVKANSYTYSHGNGACVITHEPEILADAIAEFYRLPSRTLMDSRWDAARKFGYNIANIDVTKKDLFVGFLTSVIMSIGDLVKSVVDNNRQLYTHLLNKEKVYIVSPYSFPSSLYLRSDAKDILQRSIKNTARNLKENQIVKKYYLESAHIERLNSFCINQRATSPENGNLITVAYMPSIPYSVRSKNPIADDLYLNHLKSGCSFFGNPKKGYTTQYRGGFNNVELTWTYVLADDAGIKNIAPYTNKDVLLYNNMSEKTSINIRIINRQRDTLFSFEIPLAITGNIDILNQIIGSAFQQNYIDIENQEVDGYEIDVFSGLCCDDRQIICLTLLY